MNLRSQRVIHGLKAPKRWVKGFVSASDLCDPFGGPCVVWMGPIGKRLEEFFVPWESSGVYQRSSVGAVEHSGGRSVVRRGALCHQLKMVQPAVAEIVFIKDRSIAKRQQLGQG